AEVRDLHLAMASSSPLTSIQNPLLPAMSHHLAAHELQLPMPLLGVDDGLDVEHAAGVEHPHVGPDAGAVADADADRPLRLHLGGCPVFRAAEGLHGGPHGGNVLPLLERLTCLVLALAELLDGDPVA